jgi:trk system potassium uptake protein TrkH
MPDLRPVAHIIGLMLAVLGALMLVPAALAWWTLGRDGDVFLVAASVTSLTGILTALATRNALGGGLTLRQSFLLTTLTWVVLPAFGALPFLLKADPLSVLDAYFESMSGMTTTGTTILPWIESWSAAMLLWRSILQWLGGLGIVIVALIFLPVMKVGGMQHFRSEGFDTMGKIMPRVADISLMLLQVYAALTILAALGYLLAGLGGFDALNHALTTIATGGFSTRDASFTEFGAGAQYVAIAFMWLSGLPLIRFVQLVNGQVSPLWRDVQVRAYLRWSFYFIALIVAWRFLHGGAQIEAGIETVLRETAFNTVSIMTGTGYGTADPTGWGQLPLLILIVAGFVGACTASTGCAIKVFRFLVLFQAIKVQLRQLIHPSRVVPIHLDGKRLGDDVIASVIVMFTAFVLGFGVLVILLSLTGLETRTAITAAWTAICNIGPAFGPEVGATGAVNNFPATAKALMIVGMLMGRLEMVAVLVLFLPRFWRD